ncbi:MAG: metallophosphoesterase, partial [Leeuwenhoekiella sp.]
IDFYKIRNADKLAFQDVFAERLEQYSKLIEGFLANPHYKKATNENAHKLHLFMSIFNKFLHGLPADHFKIDLKSGKIVNLE